jgi:hypothetical protein
MLAQEASINLEVLDNKDNAVSGTTAVLRHLDGEWATVCVETESRVPCLHWGSRVRFFIGEGTSAYECIGTVTAHALASRSAADSPTASGQVSGELLLRLHECRPCRQKRKQPRRFARFAVHFRPLETRREATESSESPDAAGFEEQAETWLRAWCVDIGGGGMRIRAARLNDVCAYVQVRFALPAARQESADSEGGRSFCLTGRVLRSAPCGRHADSVEMAVRFVDLSVEEGAALSAFLAG